MKKNRIVKLLFIVVFLARRASQEYKTKLYFS